MLKQLRKIVPYLLLSLSVAGLSAFLEAKMMIEMTNVTDRAISGDIAGFKLGAPYLVFLAVALVPICIIHSGTYALYKKKANLRLKAYYMRGIFDKNISEFHKENNAKYVSGLTNDFNMIETNLIESIYEICRSFFAFLAGIWMVVSASPWTIVLVFIIVVFNIIFSQITSKPVGKHMTERSDLFERYTSYIKEVISAFHIIKSNNLQERVRTNFGKKSEEVQHKGYVIDKLLSYIQALQNSSMNITLYFLLLACTYMAITDKMTIGGALLVIQGAQMVMWPIMNISERLPKLFTVKELIKKLETTFKNTDTYEETERFEGLKEGIVLQSVSFGYEEDNLVLDSVDLQLKKGGKYLVIGPSGGGKSTLLKLLRKYFNPIKGEVLLDGKVLKDIKKEDFYNNVANVEQQVFIFEDTLRNNITLYKHYTEEEIWQAIKRAGLTEFVAALPEGIETMIYDNGSNVSGGERSRIVIARGLLRKASIIFLDEAFAALDMERAREIEASILDLEDVTVINISHVVFKENKERYDGVFTVRHQQVECAV